jgi:squalene-hopene/tetraprenyl-beta-curcumene cyclase
MRRALLFALPVLFVGTGCSKESPSREESIRKAVAVLWSRQATDGGWHSAKYGLLKSGQSLTPFVLNTLLDAPGEIPVENVDRALAFLRRHTDRDGAVGRMDPVSEDYPNYATALSVLAIYKAKRPGYREQAAPLVECLRRQQFADDRGYHRDAPVYGGWGMGGDLHTSPHTGHVDLSMTRYVLQALAAAGVAAGDPAFERAQVFLGRCQNGDAGGDGGFFFSPVILDANKAGEDGSRFRSYGTTTADGLLGLIASGVPVSDTRVQAAAKWLRDHRSATGAPGFVDQAHARWTGGLRFYYAAASVEAGRRVGSVSDAELVADLIKTQRGDGLWVNPDSLVKEDDPLIATPFAVAALLGR